MGGNIKQFTFSTFADWFVLLVGQISRLERRVAAISDLLIKFVPREKIGLEFFIEILLNSFEFF